MSDRVRQFHFADADDWHANDAETSLMLSERPWLVREEVAAQSDDPDLSQGLVFAHPVNRTSENGVTGLPSRASAAKGRVWFEWMIEDLCDIVVRGMRESPPLAHGYDSRAS
jgi:creatinine amidohydrolase